MKNIVWIALWMGVAALKTSGMPSLRARPARRLLPEWPYAFLVSHVSPMQDWCIVAKHGTRSGSDIGFCPCDYENAPQDQLWLMDEEGKIHSRVNPYQCLCVNDGTSVYGGARIKFADCATSSPFVKFDHNRATGQIKVREDPSFCLKQTGNGPDLTDTIRTEKCTDHECFTYTYKDYGCSTSLADVTCCEDSDCVGSTNYCELYRCSEGCVTNDDCPDDSNCIGNVCIIVPPSFDPSDAVFLVSDLDNGKEWCISAKYGIGEFEDVGFDPCDFVESPPEQLWHLENDGTIRSDVDQTRCLVVGSGHSIFGGLMINIASCDIKHFNHDPLTGHIHPAEDESYCLMTMGQDPAVEKVCAKPCENEANYKFTLLEPQ